MDERMTGPPVSEFWYALQPQNDDIVRFAEVHVDPYAVGDIWLVRGAELALAVDTGSGVVPSGPIIEAVAGIPVLAVALTSSYDHAGGWHSFRNRACHLLDTPELAKPSYDVADDQLRDLSDE